MRKKLVDLLEQLLVTHSPGGDEGEMDAVIRDRIASLGAVVDSDPHGNLLLHLPGREPGPLTVVCAHKDELSLAVRKIDEGGRMWLDPVGGSRPSKYGEGPFDLVTRHGVIEGILCIGSTHSSDLSARIHKAKTGLLSWDHVYLDCKLSAAELKERGAMVGDRAVIGRARKKPLLLRDEYICGYALDDKAAVAVLILLAERLLEAPPRHGLCLAFTSAEEGGVSGGLYACRHLDPNDVIAIEIAPVAEEYPITMGAEPVMLFKDGYYHYSPALTRELLDAGGRADVSCQAAVIRSFGSDASAGLRAGFAGRGACVCFPTENTHGYEVTSLTALTNTVEVLAAHLC